MGDFVMVGQAIYTTEDVAKLLDELSAARLAVAPPLPRQVRAETDKIRAEVAEGIARAIEAEMRRDKHGVSAWVYGWQDGLNDAAAIARGYTHGQDPADS